MFTFLNVLKKEMFSLLSLEERLKQNARVHSVKGESGGEKRRGKKRRGEGREGREREKKRKERERGGEGM